MKRRFLFLLLILAVLPVEDLLSKESFTERTRTLVGILQKFHYRELTLDDQSSSDIKKTFLKNLDPFNLYFVDEDITRLTFLRLDLSDETRANPDPFFSEAVNCYGRRLKEARETVSSIGKEPFEYISDERIAFSTVHADDYAKDKTALLTRWKKLIKYRTLFRLYTETKNSGAEIASMLPSSEPKIRADVIIKEQKIIDGILAPAGGFQEFVFGIFQNAITSQYDPHTVYFSARDKKAFESLLSSKSPSFGMSFTKTLSGDFRIDRIVPGGPAWKSGKLAKGDQLIDINFSTNADQRIDLNDYNPDSLVQTINNSRSDKMTLMVKKTGGLTVKVTLAKEKLIVEENAVQSFILNGSKRIGYICLPSFYTDFETLAAPGCANDVAKEILKLRKEKIDGLILDLRNNGGGAMTEALALAGIFIDEGPIAIQGLRRGKTFIIKDPDRGTVYDGPLAVMVNHQSASASEFFVAAMKDYNRAVIIGSNTFGKASGQIVIPAVKNLNATDPRIIKSSSDDYLKITTNLFFNLSGRTHQQNGITPDVILPDVYETYDSEKGYAHSLQSSIIQKMVHYEPLEKLPTEKLSDKSRSRIAKDPQFKELLSISAKLNNSHKEQVFILTPNEFVRSMNELSAIFDSLEKNLNRTTSAFHAENNAYDNELLKIDPYRKMNNENATNRIMGDIYIEEAFRVVNDLVDLQKQTGEK